ncbi:FadR family transcriptional regulator [Microbacterium bovistercoris]|uniref:FadR family transcriptional regulator n=1 Tax=Microbacterium bovistercoris TaxID=2293570 RepID=A0A371NR36_9MICO|nr:FCD domain-containing protein [Microbacterium bovistercoris]REJ04654.1 FadR family transcriptional regulator [Microbacterium bovistercoris]
MAQVVRETLADRAAQLLLERIGSGEWALGERLPGETTLAPQLGVGRSTVREAIRQLAGRGVLVTRQGAGVFVSALEPRDDWDQVLRRADILAVIETRTAIESEAAALAARRRTPADVRVLRRALSARDVSRPQEGDGNPRVLIEGHVDADLALHRAIVAAAHNPVLAELFDALTPRLRLAMIDMLRMRPSFGDAPDHDAHAQLVEAVAGGQADAAAALSRAHLAGLAQALA